MKEEEEIKEMLNYLMDDTNPEPKTMPRSGYFFDVDQAIEVLEWVLR